LYHIRSTRTSESLDELLTKVGWAWMQNYLCEHRLHPQAGDEFNGQTGKPSWITNEVGLNP